MGPFTRNSCLSPHGLYTRDSMAHAVKSITILMIVITIAIRVLIRPRPIMLNILPLTLLSSAQKLAHYAQYYAHNINDATVQV